jgi:hypothetical protein
MYPARLISLRDVDLIGTDIGGQIKWPLDQSPLNNNEG